MVICNKNNNSAPSLAMVPMRGKYLHVEPWSMSLWFPHPSFRVFTHEEEEQILRATADNNDVSDMLAFISEATRPAVHEGVDGIAFIGSYLLVCAAVFDSSLGTILCYFVRSESVSFFSNVLVQLFADILKRLLEVGVNVNSTDSKGSKCAYSII
jgi:hypothetical protein